MMTFIFVFDLRKVQGQVKLGQVLELKMFFKWDTCLSSFASEFRAYRLFWRPNFQVQILDFVEIRFKKQHF